ncbi:mannose-6-phosphate receptor domain-containing protein [Cavenderia fasciculata]|uniref:Autophagy-related protein 27 n=1 Tax=Cavenderia fasciculata TaxID=261658 RepID=F4PXN6_CACFS|nr:mannose-6-phosphate receptor domain-containing protein [Cavenderia fasciculata]EGG19546.1 mannose-6-phosphate receptor domain-containing protein [Cavenderia fasciculata]|eukprot:XP_004357840.1 mannose-6-phosphate receptor domain-containing protein [Cavenderia fasciculata]
MMRVAFLIVAIIACMINGSYSAATNCVFGEQNFSGFNVAGTNYIWSVCQANTQCNNLLTATGVVSCQKPTTGTPQNTGLLAGGTWSAYPDGAATVNYKSGTAPCKSSGKVRQTNMFFTCAKGAQNKVISADESATKCIYEVFMSGDSACAGGSSTDSGPSSSGTGGDSGKKGGIGGGWIFIIILLVATTVYILAGIGFNYKVRNLRGKEMFPNYAFWADFPGLLKDGVLFIKSKVSGGGASGGSGYQQV